MSKIEREQPDPGFSPQEYVEAWWNYLRVVAEAFKEPAPDLEIAHQLTLTLETSWEALIAGLKRSSITSQFNYWRHLTRDFTRHEKLSHRSWKDILELRAKRWVESREEKNNPPFNRPMSQTEGRIAVMTSGLVGGHGLLNEVLHLYDDERRIKPEAYSFFLVMTAFNASLPWNRTGENPITLSYIKLDVAEEASQYIQHRLEQITGK